MSRSERACCAAFSRNARFAVVPGAGHWVQYEAADRFNAMIAEFAAG